MQIICAMHCVCVLAHSVEIAGFYSQLKKFRENSILSYLVLFHAIFVKQMARESKFPQFLNIFYVKSYSATLWAQKLQFWPFFRP